MMIRTEWVRADLTVVFDRFDTRIGKIVPVEVNGVGKFQFVPKSGPTWEPLATIDAVKEELRNRRG